MSEWLKETGCKPVGSAYAGSNPAPSIVGRRWHEPAATRHASHSGPCARGRDPARRPGRRPRRVRATRHPSSRSRRSAPSARRVSVGIDDDGVRQRRRPVRASFSRVDPRDGRERRDRRAGRPRHGVRDRHRALHARPSRACGPSRPRGRRRSASPTTCARSSTWRTRSTAAGASRSVPAPSRTPKVSLSAYATARPGGARIAAGVVLLLDCRGNLDGPSGGRRGDRRALDDERPRADDGVARAPCDGTVVHRRRRGPQERRTRDVRGAADEGGRVPQQPGRAGSRAARSGRSRGPGRSCARGSSCASAARSSSPRARG